ncbi:M23 family metallopeptidase [Rhodoferax sp. BLA1]|uniref:M23 family metallopeptidase n=1 Tax=Rhodoferax sp. BLA1 TaxID=2576062 RepID=UPI0015D4626F|nr:M23 family metallopeptidase [Rhodoferax sp. BLA1]
MQLIITDARLAKSRVVNLTGGRLAAVVATIVISLMLTTLGVYHWVILKGAREGWPVVGSLVKLVSKDDVAQRDRFLRENLDLMARQLGEMQAKLQQLESLGERVSGLAGLPVPAAKALTGSGGPLVASRALSMEEVQSAMVGFEELATQRSSVLTALESKLFDLKMKRMMTPTQKPVTASDMGSGFGWRVDPFSGRSALHTGQDYAAPTGTPILAAAGGVVVTQEYHAEYGNMVEIDHGGGLITRYAHASRTWVKKGDLIKRGQKIAEVGTSGRSTGAHLHFEVWVQGVVQDPQKFLAVHPQAPATTVAALGNAAARPAALAASASPK